MDALKPTGLQPTDLVNPVKGGKPADKDAALAFEGMLWTQIFQGMRKTVESSGLFGDEGQARSTYEYLFDQVVVQSAMASGKSLGLAERLAQKPGKAPDGQTASTHSIMDGNMPIGIPSR